MKKILLLVSILFITGCSCQPVKEEVWTPPKFDMPQRPVLKSDGKGTDGEIARKNSDDLILMRQYAFSLENLLNSIKARNGDTPVTIKKIDVSINKQ